MNNEFAKDADTARQRRLIDVAVRKCVIDEWKIHAMSSIRAELSSEASPLYGSIALAAFKVRSSAILRVR